MTKKKSVKVLLNWNGRYGYGFKVLMALAQAVPALLQNKIWLSNKLVL